MTTVCLTFDFDAVSIWVSTFKQTSAMPLSRGEFSAHVGVPRVLALLRQHDVSATFFVPAHTAGAFPASVATIFDGGHEIALHGYCHESPVGLSREMEADLLDRSMEKLSGSVGHGFSPAGYRSPAFDLSANTIELLEDRGILYDSSLMASDFSPHFALKSGWADEHAYHPGIPSNVIEIPVAWELDDFPYFQFLNRPLFSSLRTTDDVFSIWKEEFDFCHSLPDGVFTLTMHPEIIGRGPRIALLDRLIHYIKTKTDVRFTTVRSEAERQMDKLRQV